MNTDTENTRKHKALLNIHCVAGPFVKCLLFFTLFFQLQLDYKMRNIHRR